MELKAVDLGTLTVYFSQYMRNQNLTVKKYVKKKEVTISRFCVLCNIKQIKKWLFLFKNWVKIRGKFIAYSLCLEYWLNHCFLRSFTINVLSSLL